jgi:hypothetical protein
VLNREGPLGYPWPVSIHARLGICLGVLALHGCAEAREQRTTQPSAAVADIVTAITATPRAVVDAPTPVLLITDREALAALEQRNLGFARVALGHEGPDDTATLARDPRYVSIQQRLVADLRELVQGDPSAGVEVRGHPHRIFDERYLRSRRARFELVAVVNRLDRRFFTPGSCGELRLVYRLAYRQQEGASVLASRLPLTVAVELRVDEDGTAFCREQARRWLLPPGLTGRALAERMVADDGALFAASRGRAPILRLNTNMQSVRWPSAVRPRLGGHAEYVLRSFVPHTQSGLYVPHKLENTPDVAKIARNPGLKRALAEWLLKAQAAGQVDSGLMQVPDAFLAESVVSVTPRGLARRANRPFRGLFDPALFADAVQPDARFARSPEAILRRLDDLTCSGCHQSRSIAGFHLLGEDDGGAHGNALAVSSSPHVFTELERRRSFVQALARGEPVDLVRPFAERGEHEQGGYAAHCGLGDPGFRHWTCADGLRCDPYDAATDEQTVGVCLPLEPQTGDPCEPDRVLPNVDAHRDGTSKGEPRACPFVCERTSVGFPGGMCAGRCEQLGPEAACGAIAVLSPFNACLARKQPFAACVRDHVRPAGLRACNERSPCRDDYVCVQGASGGVCLPPYFVFQMRVDGHARPEL